MSFSGDLDDIVAKNESGLLSSHPSWSRVRLGEVAEVINGYPFESRFFGKTKGVPLLRIRDILSSLTDTRYAGPIPEGYWVDPGEIIVGMDGDFNCARWGGERALLNQRVCKIVVDRSVMDASFLHRVLGGYLAAINQETSSTTVKHLSSRTIEQIPLPYPPLDEQKRIVNKLESLVRRVDEGRKRLDNTRAIIARFRRSVLESAIRGQLTTRWRESRSLPSWTKMRAADACDKVQSGGTPKEGFVDVPGVPFLKVYNIVHQQVDFRHRPQYLRVDLHEGPLRKSCTMPGDVLMNIVGPPLGKVAIVPDDFPEWNINQALTLFRPSTRISTGWLYIVLSSGLNVAAIAHETKGSAGQTNISLSQCRDFEFPVPSPEEQAEIVDIVNLLVGVAEELEKRHSYAARCTDRLAQSLLVSAFRGELVAQHPSFKRVSDPSARLQSKSQDSSARSRRSTSERK